MKKQNKTPHYENRKKKYFKLTLDKIKICNYLVEDIKKIEISTREQLTNWCLGIIIWVRYFGGLRNDNEEK